MSDAQLRSWWPAFRFGRHRTRVSLLADDIAARVCFGGTKDGERQMALDLRPGCECCDRDLPPESAEAMICTFECTFCASCAEDLGGICPNCGGELVRRPIRPAAMLEKHPASTTRIFKPQGCAKPLK